MPGNWVVLQSAEEVDLALKLDPVSGPYSYFATSLDAQSALESRGLPCRHNLEFSSIEETNSIAWENYPRLRRAIDGLEEALHDLVPGLPQEFRPFQAVEYGYKNLADSLSFTLWELNGLVREESPSRLIYWGRDDVKGRVPHDTRPAGVGSEFSMFPPDESIVSAILDHHEWWRRLGVEPIRMARSASRGHPNPTRRWRSRLRRILNPNRVEAFKMLRGGMGGPVLGRGRPRLLVIGKADNVVPFIEYAQSKHGAQVDWWTNASFDPVRLPTLAPIWLGGAARGVTKAMDVVADMACQADPRSHWAWDGDDALPVGEILWTRLIDFWSWRVPQLLSLYFKALRYFEAHRPVTAVCGTSDPDRIQVILQAAKHTNVPLVSFQHGGAYGYMLCEWIRLSDLRAQVYAGYGPAGCLYLNALAENHDMAPSAVSVGWARGSVFEERARSVEAPNGKNTTAEAVWRGPGPRLIYAPTALMGGDLRYGPHRDVRDTEYFYQQVRLIKALSEVSDLQIVVKPHYQDKIDNPFDRWIIRLGNPRVRLVRSPGLDALLPEADVVVLDVPATGLIEAMALGKPIVYVDFGVFKLTGDSADLLRRSVAWVDAASDFDEQLKSAVAQSLSEPPSSPHTNVFLSAYASLDFRPELVWDKLQEIRNTSTCVPS